MIRKHKKKLCVCVDATLIRPCVGSISCNSTAVVLQTLATLLETDRERQTERGRERETLRERERETLRERERR